MDFKQHKAIYLQIAERLCDEILGGEYGVGERMPSVRDYAGTVEVNVNTVVRSYDWLQQNGVIYQRRGLGYFIADDAPATIRQLRRAAFFAEMLPELARTMQTLGITVEELKEHLQQLE